MNLVTAILQPDAVDDVQIALHQHGINGMTLTEVSGYARQRGHEEVYRGDQVTVDFTDKGKLEILATEQNAPVIAAVIAQAARTGTIGDGKIWITRVDEFIRISTGERGEAAVCAQATPAPGMDRRRDEPPLPSARDPADTGPTGATDG